MIIPFVGMLIVLGCSSVETSAQVEDRELEKRIFNLGLLRTGKSSNKTVGKKRDPNVLLAEVQGDFTSLQIANNQLAEANEKNQSLDLQFVQTSVKEIRLRAERLMENLSETKVDKKEPTSIPTNQRQLKNLISLLDTVVEEFTHNRVFKEASEDDEKLAKKALKDLDQIIRLSVQLLKGVETMKE